MSVKRFLTRNLLWLRFDYKSLWCFSTSPSFNYLFKVLSLALYCLYCYIWNVFLDLKDHWDDPSDFNHQLLSDFQTLVIQTISENHICILFVTKYQLCQNQRGYWIWMWKFGIKWIPVETRLNWAVCLTMNINIFNLPFVSVCPEIGWGHQLTFVSD